MNGAVNILKLLKQGDNKWDIGNYKFTEMVTELNESDIKIAKALDNIGDGELSAIGIIVQHQDLVRNYESREIAKDFYESVMYGFSMINYEEMRHGFIFKELASIVKTGKSFIEDVDSSLIHELMFETNELYKNPYESLISYLIGEITNVELYSSIEKKIENDKFREIIRNIRKDEQKHKAAWLNMIKRMVKKSNVHKENFAKAVRDCHFIHQAEISNYFVSGAQSVEHFFTPVVSMTILDEKLRILENIFGESPLSKKQLFVEFNEYFQDNILKKAV